MMKQNPKFNGYRYHVNMFDGKISITPLFSTMEILREFLKDVTRGKLCEIIRVEYAI
ncbi:MAG: hypothetical protein WCO84_00915 [bacterium]